MKWTTDFQHDDGLRFEIEEDEGVGFYFYVFNAEGKNIRDELQDTLEWTTKIAKKDFGVPQNSWRKLI